MHILVISQFFLPEVGGVSTRAYNVVKGLLEVGHSVTVISALPRYQPTFSRYKKKILQEEYMNSIRVIRVWVPFSVSTGFARRFLLFSSFMVSSLFALGIVKNVQVVWVANPNFFSLFPGLIYSFINNCPLVRNVDDLWPEAAYDLGFVKLRVVRGIIDFISKVSYLLPNAITVLSPSYKEVISSKYGVRRNKIHIVEVGVDVDVFHPLRREGKSNRFIVMYSGNLGLAYDFDTVLESARLLSRYRNIIIVIRGRGDLVPIVKTKIKELGLRNIFLHTERVERSELCKVLNSADVFLLPHRALNSAEKGLPTKLFEYQACGKPIICSSRGEPARYVKSTKSGIVVPPEDPEALSKAILELYRDEEKRRMLGMNGWIYVSTHLTTEKIGARISRVFHELLKT